MFVILSSKDFKETFIDTMMSTLTEYDIFVNMILRSSVEEYFKCVILEVHFDSVLSCLTL